MTTHVRKEIDKLKDKLLTLCGYVEDSLWKSVKSVMERDEVQADEVFEIDNQIDQMEVDVEEECLKILALHQPVATDLRYIVTALKINNDLERIGDLAVNIAERGDFLASHQEVSVPFAYDKMAEKTLAMVRKSIDALVKYDSSLAHEVCIEDDEVDSMNREVYNIIKDMLVKQPDDVNVLIHMLSVSRHLERIADHATNIAEDVIYMVEGKIVRHKIEEY